MSAGCWYGFVSFAMVNILGSQGIKHGTYAGVCCLSFSNKGVVVGLIGRCCVNWASQVALVAKNLPAIAGDVRDTSLIPRSGRSPGGWHGNPLQYSWLGPRP